MFVLINLDKFATLLTDKFVMTRQLKNAKQLRKKSQQEDNAALLLLQKPPEDAPL